MNSDKERFERVIKLLPERLVDDFVRGDLWNGYYQRELNIILDQYNNTKEDILNQFKNKKLQTAYIDFNQKFSNLHRFLIEHFSIPISHYDNGGIPPFYYLEPEYHHNFFVTENGRGRELHDTERSRIWREYKTELEGLSGEFHDAYKNFISTAKLELDTHKPFWRKPTVIIGILGLIIAFFSSPYWYTARESKLEKTVTQSHTGAGDNVLGDKNVTYSVASLPSRELNEQIASCILDQLSKIGGKRVSFELYGSLMTVKNETGGGMFGQPPDNETVNFTKEVANLLKENNYQVNETYTSISSFSVDEAAFTGFLIKKGNEEDTISIHIGPNDGRQITCI